MFNQLDGTIKVNYYDKKIQLFLMILSQKIWTNKTK